jgi:hypothetical protein
LKLDIEKRYYKILEKIYLKEYKETNLDLEEKQKIYLEVRRIMVEKRKV